MYMCLHALQVADHKIQQRLCGILYLNDIQIGVGLLHSVKQLANYYLKYLQPFITNNNGLE